MCIQLGTFCIVAVVVMFRISWICTIPAVILVSPGSLTWPLYGKYNSVLVALHQAAKAKSNSLAEERIGNVRTVKAFADEQDSAEKFKAMNDEVYAIAVRKGNLWGVFMGCIVSFSATAICAMILIISTQVDNRSLTIGVVLTYLMYMQILSRNVGEMLTNVANLSKIQGATIAIAEIIYAPIDVNPIGTEQPRNITTVDDDTQIGVENVSFAYPTKPEVPILHNVSLKVPKNNIVALVGASGCGKSSIISLVERWYDPVEGKFTYNGKNLQDIDNTWYH